MNQSDSEVKTVLSRMKTIFKVEKDADLARALNISPQTLSSWKQRSAIPYSLCVECAKTMGASLDWLLYGEGEMLRTHASDEKTPRHKNGSEAAYSAPGPDRGDVKGRILNILEGLSDEDLGDILSEAEHRKRLRILEQRFEDIQNQFFEARKNIV